MYLYTSNDRENQFNTEYPNRIEIASLSDLLQAVKYDHVSGRMKNNHRGNDNFICCDGIMFDLDNTHSSDREEWKTCDDLREAFPDVRFYVVNSRNHMKAKRKTDKKTGEIFIEEPRGKGHIYYPSSHEMDIEEARQLFKKALAIFPAFDVAAAKPAQFFFGVEDPKGEYIDGELTIDQFLENVPDDQWKQTIKEVSDKVSAGKWDPEKFDSLKAFFGVGEPESSDEDHAQQQEGIDWIKRAEQRESLHRLEAWAEKNNVIFGKRYPVNTDNHPDAIAICVDCPWKDSHTSDGPENESVIIVDLNGKLNYLCRHDHCVGRSWKDYREAIEAAAGKNDGTDQKVTTTTDNGKIVPATKKKAIPKLTYVSAAELSKANLPKIYYPIDGLIPEGLSLLAAPPKSAKSWMALDECLSVASGKDFLGFPTNQSNVVYFALEDGDKFEQERLNILCDPDRIPENFHYVFKDVVPLDVGFIEQLDNTLEAFPGLRFVVIDTLKFVACSQKKNESAYERDYRTGQMLKSWADDHGVAILVITHTTKLVHPDDALANVSGTNGLTGAADAVLVIAKEKRTSTDAVLAVDGRRVRQAEYEIRINWDSCRWEFVGVADPDERERKQREKMINDLRESTAYKAALMLADKNVDGWSGSARKLVNDAAQYGVFVMETPKEVGRMLSNNIAVFAQDGVKVEVIKNGTGSNLYRMYCWEVSE